MARPSTVLVVAFLVTVLIGALAVGGAIAADGSPERVDDLGHPTDGPAVEISIDVQDNGDARWAITHRFSTATSSEEAAFNQLVNDLDAGTVDPWYSTELFEGYRDAAATVVDREMAIRDATWEDSVDDDIGEITFLLTWTNFAETTDNGVIVGDAFTSQDGTWFETLGEDTRLAIHAPPNQLVDSSPTAAEIHNNSVVWQGPATFERGDFEIRFVVDPDAGVDGLPGWLLAGVIVILLVLVGVGGAVGYREGWLTLEEPPVDAEDVDGDEPPVEPIDEELLSDPERVERMLATNGGRMKQAAIIEETGWSSAKVSQLLSTMADEGRIEKLRIGQENLISLPEDDGDAAEE